MNRKSIRSILIIVMGIILAGAAIFALTRPKTDYLTCEGTIVRIEEDLDLAADDTNVIYKVYVDYTVDGKEYKEVDYGSYNSSMKEGGKVTVYYDPADPSKIQAEGFETVPYVVLGAGIVAVIIGVIIFIKERAR